MPLHLSKRRISAHLSADLRDRYAKRSIPVRKGDRVIILKGDFKGIEGDIVRVVRESGSIFVEGANRENARGERTLAPIAPSALVIVKLKEDDKRRRLRSEESTRGAEKTSEGEQ